MLNLLKIRRLFLYGSDEVQLWSYGLQCKKLRSKVDRVKRGFNSGLPKKIDSRGFLVLCSAALREVEEHC